MSLYPLANNQAHAVDPQESVWLSASAGTGKTQVLSARVLRLLLQPDVTPSQILCLTFTKAGAAEMALRVNEVLAGWVRMTDTALAGDLRAIGADFDPPTLERARTLFASVLDCPGGLRIDTIHAFSQWLLSVFPEEAELAPGARPMEDRDREVLARDVLARLLVDAEERNEQTLLDALAMLSMRLGPDEAQSWLMRCATATPLWLGPGAWAPPFRDRLNILLGLDADEDEAKLAARCADNAFDVASVRKCMAALKAWGTKTGGEHAATIATWLAMNPAERLTGLEAFASAFFTKKGEARATPKGAVKHEPAFGDYAARVVACINEVKERKNLLALAAWLEPALILGRKFALAWEEAKMREGLVDFDDQIRRAADLLTRSDLSAWIRYKLDRRIDHVLIDEAQDTNADQWKIIFALIEEYFAGEGATDGKMRTMFTVGDYKQAIFRFQGTSPKNFEISRSKLREMMASAAANARELRSPHLARDLQVLGLDRSYRTGQPVLDFVDAAIERIGQNNLGLPDAPARHEGEERPGQVILWPYITMPDSDDSDGDGDFADGADGEEQGWLSRSDRQLADRIAQQVRLWMDEGFPLWKGVAKGKPARRAGPGDIMVLVRQRKELAGLIVARLYAAGVPVAGMDRLRLGAPLAVKDLLAALRFAVQPHDDLNLASLLVSPLIGWSQQDLLDHGYRPGRRSLWTHLRASNHDFVSQTLDALGALLALADYEPPHALLHWILVGPWEGRRKLVARLGKEANDPIDELINAAFAHASSHTPSLQGFLRWFGDGESELKREMGAADGLVRVMTVHGAKGLQAPIVILADATANPGSSRIRNLTLEEATDDLPEAVRHPIEVPIPTLPAEQRCGRIADAYQRIAEEEQEEHWRLLYVAMTRAEEALFIAGALGKRDKVPAENSWYDALAPLFDEEPLPDPIWQNRRQWGGSSFGPADGPLSPVKRDEADEDQPSSVDMPAWALVPVGPEPRPPRPLAPSSAGQDDAPTPPLSAPRDLDAAQRGILIHRLLERLPDVPAERRADIARQWLARQAPDLADDAREEIAQAALGVLAVAGWAELFGADALAEVPLAAIVGDQVITGTVDRLLVRPDRVAVVDFKTTRRPAADARAVAPATLRQMAAYVAALEVIYPGRQVEAAVLFTHTPSLVVLPPDLIAQYRP